MLAEPPLVAPDLASETARIAGKVDALFGDYLKDPGDGRDRLFAAMRHAGIGGGKRLRPLLTVAAGRLFGIDEAYSLRAAAAIIVIVHAWQIVVDQRIDVDRLDRRAGRPCTACSTRRPQSSPATAFTTSPSRF